MAEASLLESPEIAAKLALLKQKRKSILAALHKTIENAERKQTAAGPSLDVRAQQPQQQQPQQQQQQQLHPHRSVLNTARSPQQPITGWASDDSDEHAEELPREIRVAGALRIKVQYQNSPTGTPRRLLSRSSSRKSSPAHKPAAARNNLRSSLAKR